MSDKITKTVIYEIEPSGDCLGCSGKLGAVCIAFYSTLANRTNGNLVITQCEDCKDFLAEEKAKVYCDGCMHFIYNWTESECTKGNENTCGEAFARDDWYCNNCTDRGE